MQWASSTTSRTARARRSSLPERRRCPRRSGATYSSASRPARELRLHDPRARAAASPLCSALAGDAARSQRVHLVLHEGDERRDHDRGALEQERGQLEAERLAGAGGHHRDEVPALAARPAAPRAARAETPARPKRSWRLARARCRATRTWRWSAPGESTRPRRRPRGRKTAGGSGATRPPTGAIAPSRTRPATGRRCG